MGASTAGERGSGIMGDVDSSRGLDDEVNEYSGVSRGRGWGSAVFQSRSGREEREAELVMTRHRERTGVPTARPMES